MLKEYEEMKEEIKKFKTLEFMEDFSLIIKQCYHSVWSIRKTQTVKIQNLEGQKTEE